MRQAQKTAPHRGAPNAYLIARMQAISAMLLADQHPAPDDLSIAGRWVLIGIIATARASLLDGAQLTRRRRETAAIAARPAAIKA